MTKHQIENICWREVHWQRPFEPENVWDTLTHLSALSPRGAVIWEVRGRNGQVSHLLGADQICIGKIEEALQAHGDIQFREVSGGNRTPAKVARQLKITRPILSLNTEISESVIRAGLAAMAVSIQRYRYLLTSQLQRLYFTDAATPAAALRATSRVLKRLRELGLIEHLARRIGGVRAGSGSLVWHLTHAGERLLYLNSATLTPTKRFSEPSPYFLAHTLAVADVAAELTELCREKHGAKLTVIQPEPDCWRTYSEYGTVSALKPDLFAITVSGQYEDRWFIEVDLDTESPNKIIGKCEKYHKYYHTGLEQQEAEVFPLTVWIVPTTERKEKLITHIRAAFNKQPKLFAVITKDELAGLIRYGGDGGLLC